jgi:cation transport protein ChaC
LTFDQPFRHLSPDEITNSLNRIRAQLRPLGSLWIFAYGSLMWRPCFAPAQSRTAQLPGFARRLCIWTIEARGTPQCPGLGLGLDEKPGASCEGLVYRVAEAEREQALVALWEREMLTGIYQPEWVTVVTREGPVTALGFVADPKHPQYAARQTIAWQAERVATAVGVLGTCFEYLERTVDALDALAVHDQQLHLVLDEARRLVDDELTNR